MGIYAIKFKVFFTPKEPIEVPGFTVKFVKSLVINRDEGGIIKSLLLEGGANKPIQLSPIMVGSKPLLSSDPVKLVPGSRYWIKLGMVCSEGLIEALSNFVSELVKDFAELLSIEVTSEHLEVLSKAPNEFTFKVLTPAVIKARDSSLIKYPTLKELISSPIKVLGRVLWEMYSINVPTTWAWRISAYYVMTEARGKVVRVDLGDGRVVEGVVGTWGFKRVSNPPKYLGAVLAKVLAIADAVGVGKSRGIGFGLTEVIK